MPYGAGPILRSAMVHVHKPWQRVALCLVMVAAGVALVALGHVAGVLLAVAGVGALGRVARRRRRPAPPLPPARGPRPSS
ncbi:MAG TPA: hypothetical protein VMB72_07060 [Acidimicrobiales bacterium]|nr:hypothetical protein [Acidimicrobiales bacterium]